MFGTTSASHAGVSGWISPGSGSTGRASGTSRSLSVVERVLAHDDDDLRLDDRELLDDARDARRVGERRVGHRALHAERPVDGERVDRQALERLHQRRARAPVERDALLDLRRDAART